MRDGSTKACWTRSACGCSTPQSQLRGRLAIARQSIEQGPGVNQVAGLEPLGEPFVRGGEDLAGLIGAGLLPEQAGEAGGGTQLERAGTLAAGGLEGPVEAGL